MSFTVYTLLWQDRVVYVGQTNNLHLRIGRHREFGHPGIEAAAIEHYGPGLLNNPRYNRKLSTST